jgi:pimeloyl-ACP methyl ester carboxylesterase
MNKKRKEIINSNEISEVYTFDLGGCKQKVLIEGKSKDLPVVLTLHGGPGLPIPFSVGCQGLFPEFTDKFIMVYWDQLGCGINNYKIDNQFHIDNFVEMGINLLDELKKMFPHNKILIFATSWGSILSAKIAEKRDDILDGVVVSGQIIKNVIFDQEVFDVLEASEVPNKKLEAIKRIDVTNVSTKQLQIIATCLRKYTDAYTNKKSEKAPMGSIIWGVLTSPDYRLRDFKAIMVNGYRNNASLWNEILQLDLSETLANMNLPYVIIQGDTDIVASTETVKCLIEKTSSANLKCQIIENTGHLPGKEMMQQVFQSLCELS